MAIYQPAIGINGGVSPIGVGWPSTPHVTLHKPLGCASASLLGLSQKVLTFPYVQALPPKHVTPSAFEICDVNGVSLDWTNFRPVLTQPRGKRTMDNTAPLKIGFIGFGAMAKAMADGWIKSGECPAESMAASRRNYEALVQDTASRGMGAFATNDALVKWADIVVVCVKPDMVKGVLSPLTHSLRDKIVLSVAAGVPFSDYEALLEVGTQHLSLLPNTPVAVNEGVLVCESTHNLKSDTLKTVRHLLGLLGTVGFYGPKEFKVAGLLSGCGPAFVALLMEGLADGAVKNGLRREEAYKLVSAMMMGTAKLQRETGAHPGVLKDAVCSPNGSTIRGVAAMEERGVRSAAIAAIDAVMNR